MLDILSEEKKKTAEGILKFEYEFNDIEAKCKIYRQRLDKKIKIIERIKECAGKKYYFQRLVERLKKENPQGIEKERKLR